MDFKALMTKLETIDKRQMLNESATSPAKKTRKVHLNENIDMKSSIARALMQEFEVNEEGDYKEPVEPQSGIPKGPSFFKDPAAAMKHAVKYRTDPNTGEVVGSRARAELNNPDPNMSGDANIAGASNPAPASQAAPVAPVADQGAEAGAPPAQYDVDQSANIYSTSQAAPQAAAQQPAAGSQADDAFQQANQEPSQDDPAQGGDAIGQAQSATQPTAQPTAQTQPAKQTTGSEMDTAAPAGITPAKPAAPTKPATPAAGGWQAIYQMNKDVIGANPNLIKPGQQLKMPDGSTYTVKAGDSLSKIAASAKPKQDEALNLIRKLAGL